MTYKNEKEFKAQRYLSDYAHERKITQKGEKDHYVHAELRDASGLKKPSSLKKTSFFKQFKCEKTSEYFSLITALITIIGSPIMFYKAIENKNTDLMLVLFFPAIISVLFIMLTVAVVLLFIFVEFSTPEENNILPKGSKRAICPNCNAGRIYTIGSKVDYRDCDCDVGYTVIGERLYLQPFVTYEYFQKSKAKKLFPSKISLDKISNKESLDEMLTIYKNQVLMNSSEKTTPVHIQKLLRFLLDESKNLQLGENSQFEKMAQGLYFHKKKILEVKNKISNRILTYKQENRPIPEDLEKAEANLNYHLKMTTESLSDLYANREKIQSIYKYYDDLLAMVTDQAKDYALLEEASKLMDSNIEYKSKTDVQNISNIMKIKDEIYFIDSTLKKAIDMSIVERIASFSPEQNSFDHINSIIVDVNKKIGAIHQRHELVSQNNLKY